MSFSRDTLKWEIPTWGILMRGKLLKMLCGGTRMSSMSLTYADDTRSRNRRQKMAPETGVGFWRQFFTPVAKFLAPETNTDE